MKKTKVLLTLACAILLVAASVLGTMAYLTDSDNVKNTFTVGKIDLTLDEAKTDIDGVPVENADRVQANTYKLMPGHEYTKDPIVHITAGSENSWVFIKVKNGLKAFEGDNKIHDQISLNGWVYGGTTANGETVYYREYTANAEQVNYPVFQQLTIADNAQGIEGWANAADQTIEITAYAIQKDGFENNKEGAWAIVSGNTAVTWFSGLSSLN